jgi:hypothetical protein
VVVVGVPRRSADEDRVKANLESEGWTVVFSWEKGANLP